MNVSYTYIICLSVLLNVVFTNTGLLNRPEISNSILYPAKKMPNSVRVISYNIRGENKFDRQQGNSWDLRKYKIQTLIDHYKPDIIGFQEVSNSYITDLERLFSKYTIIAFDINDIDKDAALLISKERFVCKKVDFFWLAQDPINKLSFAWGSRATRIVVYAKLFDLQTQRECYIYCTHFDAYSTRARFESAKTLVEQQKIISDNLPVIMLGDFNLFPDEQGEEVYHTLLNNSGLQDVRDVSKEKHYGPDGTWIGWPYDRFAVAPGTIGVRLDNIFVHDFGIFKEGVLDLKTDQNGNLTESLKLSLNVPYLSDHLPVIADVFFNSE